MAAAATRPRVAIVGGGLAGSLCALVLKSRGIEPTILERSRRAAGGRLLGGAGGSQPDCGAQFLRGSESNPSWGAILFKLEREGLLAPWRARFGVLGERGGFMPSENFMDATEIGHAMKKEEAAGTTGGKELDFCGFLRRRSSNLLYVGTPSNSDIVSGLCAAASIRVLDGMRVAEANLTGASGGVRQWELLVENGADGGTDAAEPAYEPLLCDAVVLATHDPSFAAATVSRLADSLTSAEADAESAERLRSFASALRAQRDERTKPLLTYSGYYGAGFSSRLPFDAAVVPTSSTLLFLSRDGSRPGRPEIAHDPTAPRAATGELWTAVSTPDYAARVLRRGAAAESRLADNDDGGGKAGVESVAAGEMAAEASRLLGPFFGPEPEARAPAPAWATARLWGAGITDGTLGLKEDCVSLEPWRLAVCGDYISDHSSPLEAAASSGMEAGERVAAFFGMGAGYDSGE